MRWLLYGANGWIGGQLVKILHSQGEEVIKGQSRVEDFELVSQEIQQVQPDRVVCTTGRTSGPGCPNIDYLEQPNKLSENLRDNLHGPLNLALVCRQFNIHLTYLGTGCIFEFDKDHPMDHWEGKGFTETDKPNFRGSQYSMVKGVTDQLIGHMDNVLNARIRMPISDEVNPRNFITKIVTYQKVISVPNSMTILPELLPIMLDLARRKVSGTINLTNPGAITHEEILSMYKELVDPSFTYQIMDLNELSQYTKGKRSNNYLDTTLLELKYPVSHIKDGIRRVLSSMRPLDKSQSM